MLLRIKSFITTIFFFIASLSSFGAIRTSTVNGTIADATTGEPLPFATITITASNGQSFHTITKSKAKWTIQGIPNGHAKIAASFVGYRTKNINISLSTDTLLVLKLTSRSKILNDITVTASESKGITSASRIDRQAMEHLQPSSFTDLLALLPGGKTSLPNLTQANTIHLRQAGSGNSDYDFSSLGTIFITDGIPTSTNANMQMIRQASSSSYGDPDAGRNFTNQGVDMRTIPTDNIESVEIIRGIAPVEYGDMTSGVVIINRKMRETPWEARFKADSYSKLLYVGKGFSIPNHNFIINTGIDYLDAKSDPRNNLENYKRLTGSIRFQKIWRTASGSMLRWKSTNDYTGSFDNEKNDPEILKQKDDRYRSSYNRLSTSHSLRLTFDPRNSLQFDVAATYEPSRIEQDKRVLLQRDQATSTTIEEGEHDGLFLPYNYMANVVVDGKPLSLYAKLKTSNEFTHDMLKQRLNAGIEWKMDKNYGQGQVYDPTRPLSPGTPYRPRAYSDIPAQQQLSAYISDNASLHVVANTLNIEAGLRLQQLLNIPSAYTLHGKPYLDPRVNAQWVFPGIDINGEDLIFDLSGGFGRYTKFPTLLQLFPDKIYTDLVELNYYAQNPDYRRLYLRTYIDDPTNFGLRPTRNDKWEVRFGAQYDGHNLSVTYFHEQSNSGFRSEADVRSYIYKDFDEKAIDPSILSGKPDITTLPFANDTILGLVGKYGNGSRLVKEGIEFQYSSKRIVPLKTRFTINGAWFSTLYSNSHPMFRTVTSQVVDGKVVNNLYIGYYENADSYRRQQFNTNFMADTYIERLGLSVSLTAECTWFYSSQQMQQSGRPISYIDRHGVVRPYTDTDRKDPIKQWLTVNYNNLSFRKETEPFYAYFNLKVMKDFGKWMRLALFIDRMLDYMPDYKSEAGTTIRRMAQPYFGMEINFKL